MYSIKGLHVDNFNRFNLKELEEKFEEFSLTLRKKSYKDRKIIHVGLVNQLINFFKLEYPNLNRLPLKDLLSFLIAVDIKNNDLYHTGNETNIKPKISRKKKNGGLTPKKLPPSDVVEDEEDVNKLVDKKIK